MAKTKVEMAKEEISKLKQFVGLAESFQPDTPEEHIIKEYAYYNSIPKVIKNLYEKGILKNGKEIERKDVLEVLNATPEGDLHRIIQTWYKKKTRGNRKQLSKTPKPRRNGKLALLLSLKNKSNKV